MPDVVVSPGFVVPLGVVSLGFVVSPGLVKSLSSSSSSFTLFVVGADLTTIASEIPFDSILFLIAVTTTSCEPPFTLSIVYVPGLTLICFAFPSTFTLYSCSVSPVNETVILLNSSDVTTRPSASVGINTLVPINAISEI